jgi:SH3-like domain-containing protein
MLRPLLLSLAVLVAVPVAAPASAQDRDVPYWASLRSDEVNMRVGPSESYPIDWVYRRANLPVKVVRLYQGWRRVRDPDGAEGWIVARLLSPERSALVVGEGLAPMRTDPDPAATLRWNLEPGVVGLLGDCDNGWCKFDVGGRKGWVEAKRLWGAGDP